MKKIIKDLIKKIKKYDTIIILRHNRPDGDALGTQLGLKKSIQKTFPNKKVYATGDLNPRLSFIGEMDEINDDVFENALVIICDVAVSYMQGDARYNKGKETFVIDHHTNKSDIVDDNHFICDSTCAACAELVSEILFDNRFVVDKDVALSLYTALVTDSGRFQYNETSPRTLRIAAKLLETGFDPQKIYSKLYVETIEKRKLTAEFTSRFKLTSKNVAYMFNTKETLEKYNISFNDCSRGMVSVMAGLEGILIWANFTEEPETGKVIAEFRSRGFSIVDIAKKYGGGGHDQACGATLESFEQALEVLKDFDQRMVEVNGQ
ncbi:MAG: bifunctional oligoribonuclease/PAP phosphatase NrnA [Acholeplasmatales bacterium]|nr:bifunctional oligoribonuclease/PAP phosphatase NrnA [Acholeplasmatales bacterium]